MQKDGHTFAHTPTHATIHTAFKHGTDTERGSHRAVLQSGNGNKTVPARSQATDGHPVPHLSPRSSTKSCNAQQRQQPTYLVLSSTRGLPAGEHRGATPRFCTLSCSTQPQRGINSYVQPEHSQVREKALLRSTRQTLSTRL